MPKFKPANPLGFHNPDRPSRDSSFLSGIARESISIGGVTVYAWLLQGTFDQTDAQGEEAGGLPESHPGGILGGLQDAILGENRDRRYSDDAVHLRGAYTVSQNTLDFARFGAIMLAGDIIQMEFHKEEMERLCGRRLIPGDVIEMPHLRDVGVDGRPRNRWYVVKSIVKSPTGFDMAYGWHVMGVTMEPMQDAQEFIDLMERTDDYDMSLRDQASNRGAMESLTGRIQEIAEGQAGTTWWDTKPIYIDPDTTQVYRWTEDGEPPNGLPYRKLSSFPGVPVEGEYVLRVDWNPNRLYRYQGGKWLLKEVDRKREWSPYNWVEQLRKFSTNRTEADNARPWQYVSIHDVQTPRQDKSRPSPKGTSDE
jgi:hypothetical protein